MQASHLKTILIYMLQLAFISHAHLHIPCIYNVTGKHVELKPVNHLINGPTIMEYIKNFELIKKFFRFRVEKCARTRV